MHRRTSDVILWQTFSIHYAAPGFFPVSPLSGLPSSTSTFDPFTLSLPLQQGASDQTFRRIWTIVEHVKDAFEPDYTVLQCGVDSVAGDPCATFNWSLGTSDGSLGWCVQRVVKEWPGKKLLLGGGGYHSANAARVWAFLTSIAVSGENSISRHTRFISPVLQLDHPLPLDTEIPEHSAFPLYAPSFTLDVPAGNMQDQNTEEYLASIEACFTDVVPEIKRRTSHSNESK